MECRLVGWLGGRERGRKLERGDGGNGSGGQNQKHEKREEEIQNKRKMKVGRNVGKEHEKNEWGMGVVNGEGETRNAKKGKNPK